MTQGFKDFPSSEKMRLSRPKIADALLAVRSMFSGAAFPALDTPAAGDLAPVEGQLVFRTDEKKRYQRLDTQWQQLDGLPPVVTATALRAIYATETMPSGQIVRVLGIAAQGDCAPFDVVWAPASSATADNTKNVFRPSNGAAAAGNGRWLRVVSHNNVFRPEFYGAIGDGATDDNVALQACVDAAEAASPVGTVLLTKLYATSVKITCDASNVHIIGQGDHTGLVGIGSSNIALLGFEAAAVVTTTTYNSTVAKGGKTITLTSVTGLSVGDPLMFRVTKASGYYTSAIYSFIGFITAISGSDVTIDTPFPLGLNHSTDSVKAVWKLPMLTNVRAKNFILKKGTNSHADTRGMNFWSVVRGDIDEITCEDFTGHGIYMGTGRDNTLDRLRFRNCGSTGYASIEMEGQTGLTAGRIVTDRAQGFGPRLFRSSYCNIEALIANGAGLTSTGRAVKIAQSLACNFGTIVANGSASATGLGISEGTCDCVFDTVIANRNTNEGVWFSDQSNNNNLIKSVQLYGNGGGAVPALSVYPSDNDNVILNIDTDATAGGSGNNQLYFAGARTVAKRKGGVRARYDRNSVDTASLGTGGISQIDMTTVREDVGGGYDSTNKGFKCVFPGDYIVRLSGLPDSMSTVAALMIILHKNGNLMHFSSEGELGGAGGIQVVAPMWLDQGDYVQLRVYYESGSGIMKISGNTSWTNMIVQQAA